MNEGGRSTVGRVQGAMGMASMMREEYESRPRTIVELMKVFRDKLDMKSKRGWKWGLKEAFDRKHIVDKGGFVRATGGECSIFTQEEGERLFALWSHNGMVEVADVEGDLAKCDEPDEALFANKNKGSSLDAKIVAGSKSRSNVESADSSLANSADNPYAALGNLQSAAARPITAATSKHAPQSQDASAAGVAMVTPSSDMFSKEFLNAEIPKPAKSAKSNKPSVSGGIFADHSSDPIVPSANPSRSQRSSVPGGIFAASHRPETVEYGYERFPRQGLNA